MTLPNEAIQLSWNEVYDLTLELAAAIAEGGKSFDAMVVVPRGSYYPANIIAREFSFTATDLLHACVSSYSEPGKRTQQFRLGQMPVDEQVAGKHLLIIEEVCDTGHTLRFLIDRFMEQGARSVKVGTLHYKPEQSQTGYVPDWHVVSTNQWIVYPWELHEANGGYSQVRRNRS